MSENKYKLNILKDILKFSRKKLTKEELEKFILSPLYQNKNYFTSAALLLKRGMIGIAELLNLGNYHLEELQELLEPVDNDYDYFAKVTPEEILEAFKKMEEFIHNHPEEAMKNKEKNRARVEKIKELYQSREEEERRIS